MFISGNEHRGQVAMRQADIWVSDSVFENVIPLWIGGAEEYKETGRWPVIVASDLQVPMGLRQVEIANHDPTALLRALWREHIETVGAAPAPFGELFPGLASPQSECERGASAILSGAPPVRGRLMLVATEWPAFTFTKIGWVSPGFLDLESIGMAAIAGSWYTRFGAAPFCIGDDTVEFIVERPPTSRDDRARFAAEVYAVAPDLFEDPDLTPLLERQRPDGRLYLWWD